MITSQEEDLTGKGPYRKRTLQENDRNTTSQEADFTGSQLNRKTGKHPLMITSSQEDDLRRRKPDMETNLQEDVLTIFIAS